MKNLFAIAMITGALGLSSLPAEAQTYIVNGRDASQAQAQYLASHGFQPGHWSMDGFGITLVSATPDTKAVVRTGGRSCRSVFYVRLCD